MHNCVTDFTVSTAPVPPQFTLCGLIDLVSYLSSVVSNLLMSVPVKHSGEGFSFLYSCVHRY